ncbi:MAG TPA: hypothetical protein VFR28_08990 [Allosphingosinicella sp.]|nr:hypothetical protein [Allosphingosinicella sp.]
MVHPLRIERPVPLAVPARVQLMVRNLDGGRWTVTVSNGVERFIGHYPRVPGLSSDGGLLEYRPVR